jgi:hypothetical protein
MILCISSCGFTCIPEHASTRLEAVAWVGDACSTASIKASAAVYWICLLLTDAMHAAFFQCIHVIKKDLYVSATHVWNNPIFPQAVVISSET